MKKLTAKFLGWGAICAVVGLGWVSQAAAQLVEEPKADTLCCKYECPASLDKITRGGHDTFITVQLEEGFEDKDCPLPTDEKALDAIRGCRLVGPQVVSSEKECGQRNAPERDIIIHE